MRLFLLMCIVLELAACRGIKDYKVVKDDDPDPVYDWIKDR